MYNPVSVSHLTYHVQSTFYIKDVLGGLGDGAYVSWKSASATIFQQQPCPSVSLYDSVE